MSNIRNICKAFVLCVVVVSMISCASGKEKGNRTGAQSNAPAIEAMSQAAYEATLRTVARKDMVRAMNRRSEGRSRVIVEKPYFYKEYTEYPDGPDDFEVELKSIDSRATPMLGDVRASKYRYATKLHRTKDAARDDYRFFRSTGVERISYQYMNGQWRRVGSLYMAQTTQEQVNGEWQALRENPTAGLVTEPSQKAKSRFGRVWDRIRFWK